MEKVVITGATSMLGLATLNACMENGVDKIYAIVRDNSKKENAIPLDSRIKIIHCNANNYSELPKKINDNCDAFYHFAWSLTGKFRNDDINEQAKNITYTLEALDAASELGCKKFIGAGSQAEYGITKEPFISPTTQCNPIQPYGISKYAAGELAQKKAKTMGIECFWVRVFSVFGIGEKRCMIIPSTIKKLKNKKETEFTNATQLWDFLFSEDAGNAFYSIGEYSETGKVYCLGSGVAKPLKHYLECIKDMIAPDQELGFGKLPYTENTSMNICADISELTKDTNWVPKYSFNQGIEKALDYYSEV